MGWTYNTHGNEKCKQNFRLKQNKQRILERTSTYQEPGQLSDIALGYGLGDRGFESRQGLGIFLFTTASRPALGLTRGFLPGGKAAKA
jgi:hypothetical protein